jgi:hypothetical protein
VQHRCDAAIAISAILFLIRESLRGYNNRFDIAAIRAMAEDFDMSLTATAIRLVERSTLPSFFVRHTLKGRKWFTRTPEMDHQWFPMDHLDKDSLAFDVLFGGAPEDRMLRASGADAWLDKPWADEIPIKEQTVRIYDNKVLTLLVMQDERMFAD